LNYLRNYFFFLQFVSSVSLRAVVIIIQILTTPFLYLFFNFFKIKILKIDDKAFGHAYGDLSIFFAKFYNSNERYLFFYQNSNIKPFLDLLRYDNFFYFQSIIFKKIFIFFRHFDFVINGSQFINPTYDYKLFSFKRFFIKPIFNLDDSLYRSVEGNLNFKKINCNKSKKTFSYIVLHIRHVDDDQFNSSRNTNLDVAQNIIKIIKENYKGKIVNIGHVPVDDKQFININHKLLNNEYLNLFKNAQCYVGDASGPTVIAQFIGTKSFLYNIFPFDFKTSNKKSIILYKTLNQNELHLDQNFINLLHYDSQLKRYKISLEDVNINQVKKNLIPFLKDLN